MDFSGTKRLLAVALLLSLALGGASGSGLCNLTEDDLRVCKPAVTAAPHPPRPTRACCAALAKADLPCLCSYRDSLLLPALGIDPDLAMKLPAKCGRKRPAHC